MTPQNIQLELAKSVEVTYERWRSKLHLGAPVTRHQGYSTTVILHSGYGEAQFHIGPAEYILDFNLIAFTPRREVGYVEIFAEERFRQWFELHKRDDMARNVLFGVELLFAFMFEEAGVWPEFRWLARVINS